jgi:hypothetical protein
LFNRIEKSEKTRGDLLLMGGKLAEEYELRSDFSEILRKAYIKGISDGTITVEKMIEELKLDLMKLKAN